MNRTEEQVKNIQAAGYNGAYTVYNFVFCDRVGQSKKLAQPSATFSNQISELNNSDY